MSQKTALITGVTGQDGALLAQYLLTQNYRIIAPVRTSHSKQNLKVLGLPAEDIEWIEYENFEQFSAIIKAHQPDELYHLAAMSHVGESHKDPQKVFAVNTDWTLQILQAVASHSTGTKFLFASSCEIFDPSIKTPANECHPKSPCNPYGISKLAAHHLVEYHRRVKSVFACNAILFNHESILRPESFVTQKIFKNAARISKQGGEPLELGNIYVEKDWSYAPDVIPAMHAMLQQKSPEDFVLGSESLHSVKQLVEMAFESLGIELSWKGEGVNEQALDQQGRCVVRINPQYYRPVDGGGLRADASKAGEKLSWKGSRPLDQWVAELTHAQLRMIS